MTKWIFLGDESRWLFASWILRMDAEELNEDKSLIIRRGQHSTQWNEEGKILIASTYYLPPGVEIFLPAYSDDVNINTSRFDNCAIFEMFPFGKESTEDLAHLIESSKKTSPMLLFVLMDVIENEEEDSLIGLQSGKRFLLKKHRDVLTVRDESDVTEVLHWHRPLAADLIKQIRRELQDIRTNADNIFDDYDQFVSEQRTSGCLSESVKNRIVSFATIRGKSLIWMSYQEAALKVLFPPTNTGGLNGLLELYKRTLYGSEQEKNVASFTWNVSADCAGLSAKLREKFISSMKPPKIFQSFMSSDEYNSEHIYRSLIRRGGRFAGITEEFLSRYEDFIKNEAQEILIAELDVHIKKLKEMIR